MALGCMFNITGPSLLIEIGLSPLDGLTVSLMYRFPVWLPSSIIAGSGTRPKIPLLTVELLTFSKLSDCSPPSENLTAVIVM
jgi:hypothetical protein